MVLVLAAGLPAAAVDVLPSSGPALPSVPPLPGRPPQTVPKLSPAEAPPAPVVPPYLVRPAPESLGIP